MNKDNRNENKKVEVVFIMDRSGSMGGLEADTIGGFNSMLEKQKKEPGEVIWSTVLFDHVSEVVHDRVPIGRVDELDEDTYFVRGSTALLDAPPYRKRPQIRKGRRPAGQDGLRHHD